MAQRVIWLAAFAFAVSPMCFGEERADAQVIESAAHAWVEALNELNVDEMARLATEDVVLMDATQPPISGREAARAAWRRSLPNSGTRMTSTTKELEVDEDIAWRIGALTHERASGQIVSRGQSLEIWKRVGGEWKLHRQMSSGLLARQPLLRRPLPTEPVLDSAKDKN